MRIRDKEVNIMTVKELRTFLNEHLVPSKLYKIGGHHNKRICLEKAGDGWDLYFSEKKRRIGVMHFKDEGSACAGMKNELRKMMELMYGLTWALEK